MSSTLVGQTINDQYLLTEVLGEGGMGIVFKAEDLNLNRRLCAVKLLKGQTTDPNEAKRFEAELQIISRLRSPHVVQVLNKGYFEGHRLFIVMELLEGEPLSALMKREGALSPRRSIQITKGILAGLSEAHDYGVVHRDLKPANIFITRSRAGDEITKVLDFGIAKDTNKLDDASGLTSASMIIGTPKYMAPEQFMKQDTDQRTDLYAVGLLLYQMLGGAPPYLPNSDLVPETLRTMPSEFKVGWLHINATPMPLQVAPALWDLCERMLKKQADERPATAAQVIAELSQFQELMQNNSGPYNAPDVRMLSTNHGLSSPLGAQPVPTPPPPLPNQDFGVKEAFVDQTPAPLSGSEDPSLTTGIPLVSELHNLPFETLEAERSSFVWFGVGAFVIALLIGGYQFRDRFTHTGASQCYEKVKVTPPGEYQVTWTKLTGEGSALSRGEPVSVGKTSKQGVVFSMLRRPCGDRWELEAIREGYAVEPYIISPSEASRTKNHTLKARLSSGVSEEKEEATEVSPQTQSEQKTAPKPEASAPKKASKRKSKSTEPKQRRTTPRDRRRGAKRDKPDTGKTKTSAQTRAQKEESQIEKPKTVTTPKETKKPVVTTPPEVSEPGLMF